MGDANDNSEGYLPQLGVAKHYGVSDRTIRNWEKRKLLTGVRVGGVKLYPKADVERLARKGVPCGNAE